MKHVGIWAGVIFITLAIFWGLIVYVNASPTVPSSVASVMSPKTVSENDIMLGSQDKAEATLIEYADFQCSACSAMSQFVQQLHKDFGDKLLIVYRFFPLINSHQNAMLSSQAAFAAYKQNKFWEMSELLYKNQSSWSYDNDAQKTFVDYAKKLNLDIDRFVSDYNAESTKEFINAQREEGTSIDILYAPSIFINGKLIENFRDYETFKQAVQNAIDEK